MPIALGEVGEVLQAELAASIRRDANTTARIASIIEAAAASTLKTTEMVMLREFTEPSFAEAMAMKEAGGSADAQRAMALRTSRIVPEADKAG